MKSNKAQRIIQLTNQLAETLMTAAICAQEIRSEIHDELDTQTIGPNGHRAQSGNGHSSRPLLDQSTLSVIWNGKSLHLGHTRAFWLLDRLSRHPNQYVPHLDLLRDVWDNEELASGTIRSVVRHLKRQLEDAGMVELASAICGHKGRYILRL